MKIWTGYRQAESTTKVQYRNCSSSITANLHCRDGTVWRWWTWCNLHLDPTSLATTSGDMYCTYVNDMATEVAGPWPGLKVAKILEHLFVVWLPTNWVPSLCFKDQHTSLQMLSSSTDIALLVWVDGEGKKSYGTQSLRRAMVLWYRVGRIMVGLMVEER